MPDEKIFRTRLPDELYEENEMVDEDKQKLLGVSIWLCISRCDVLMLQMGRLLHCMLSCCGAQLVCMGAHIYCHPQPAGQRDSREAYIFQGQLPSSDLYIWRRASGA